MNATDDRANDRRRFDDDSDGALLARFAPGRDQDAFAEIVARHGRMVYGVCLRRLGRTQDAEDAFQAVFLGLARHAEKLSGEASLGGWLHAVARRVSVSALRSRRRWRWTSWAAVPEPAAPATEEMNVDLDAALATLGDQERTAVILCHLEGLSRAEAAKRLAIPEGTLSARLSRALEKLRRKLRRQPVAVLAPAAVIMLPESLSAATAGLVGRLPHSPLEDLASPRVLDLSRKAVPSRLVDRCGPPTVVLAAVLVVLVGALAGWRLLKTTQTDGEKALRPPATPQNQIVTTIEQGGVNTEVRQPTHPRATTDAVRITISGVKSQTAVVWTMFATESLNGAQVQHWIQEWRGLEPLLRQLAGPGRWADVTIEPGDVSRLEANQVVNACRRAGFTSIKYRGPRLFNGDNARDAYSDKRVDEQDLSAVKTDLPDWTNRWIVRAGKIEQLRTDVYVERKMLVELAMIFGGSRGPAFGLLRDSPPAKGKAIVAQVDEGLPLSTLSVHLGAPDQRTTNLLLFKDAVASSTTDPKAFAPLIERAARASVGKAEVLVGVKDMDREPSNVAGPVNPLHVNFVLNALKRGGVKIIDYCGPPLFVGHEDSKSFFDVELPNSRTRLPKRVLGSADLTGALPDPTNGWKATLRVERRPNRDDEKDGAAAANAPVYRIERTSP